MRRSCAWAFTAPLLNPAPSAIAFDIVFREAFREVERVVLSSLLSTRATGASISATGLSNQRRRNSGTSSRLAGPILMDATPIRLGQEFSGYAQQVGYAKERARSEERRVGKECRSRWSPYH